jgi:hypothetical protein
MRFAMSGFIREFWKPPKGLSPEGGFFVIRRTSDCYYRAIKHGSYSLLRSWTVKGA